MVIVDLRPKEVDGSQVEKILELASVTVNKNFVPGDKSILIPNGLRLGISIENIFLKKLKTIFGM